MSNVIWLNYPDRPVPGDDRILARHLDYLRQQGRAATTIYTRRRLLIRLAAALEPVELLDATPAQLAGWRGALTVSDVTAVSYISHVLAFYSWAEAEGLRADNPAARLPVPTLPRRLPRPIGEQDLTAALAAAPRRIRPWLILAGWCGLRAREIALLRREHVLDAVRPPVLVVAEASAKGRRERVVPLSSFALAELRPWLGIRSGYLFGRRDGRPGPVRPWRVSQLAGQHFRGCGIGATLHQLRHRFGTQLYRQTRDLRMVQEVLGHAHPTTTALYAAWDKTAAAAAVEALPVPCHLRVVGG